MALIAVSGAVFWALQNNRSKTAPEELYSTDHRTTADGLAGLPRDYAGIPRAAPPLGPPLPGDLGRPMLNAGGAAEYRHSHGACRRPGSAAPRAGDRGGAAQRRIRLDQYPRAANSDASARRAAGRQCGARADRATFDRRHLRRERPGSKTRLRQRFGRSPHHEPRSARGASLGLCRAGRHGHSRRADHRHPIRSPRRDHGPGHGERL